MIVVRALYCFKSRGDAFRSHLAEYLYDLGYRPTKADPDVNISLAMKPNGDRYYEYILCYVDDVLCLRIRPDITMQGIQRTFKLKDDKVEEPTVYLRARLTKMKNESNHEFWEMSSEKYFSAAVKNVEEFLTKKVLRFPTKFATPLQSGYKPELNYTPELKEDGMQYYQELFGVLRWSIEIGRLDILFEVSIMSSN